MVEFFSKPYPNFRIVREMSKNSRGVHAIIFKILLFVMEANLKFISLPNDSNKSWQGTGDRELSKVYFHEKLALYIFSKLIKV